MFNIFRTLSLGIAVLLPSGCATEFSMTRSMAGVGARYGDLAAHEETQPGEIHESTTILYNLCNSYLNMRVFSKLAVCLERMEARIAKGDKDIVYPTLIGSTNGIPALYNMRAEANLEPGKLGQAFKFAERAYACTLNFPSSFLANEKSMHAIDALKKVTLIAAQMENMDQTEKSESMLESYEIGNAGCEVVSPHKSAAFTRVHFATHGKFQTEDIVEDRRKS